MGLIICQHKEWEPVLYNVNDEEVGWICRGCGLNAQTEPHEKHMDERRCGSDYLNRVFE